MAMKSMEAMNGKPCSCGKEHSCNVRVISGKDALDSLTDAVKSLGGSKVYILSDSNTFAAAGQKACRLLEKAGIPYVSHCYKQSQPIEPDEKILFPFSRRPSIRQVPKRLWDCQWEATGSIAR